MQLTIPCFAGSAHGVRWWWGRWSRLAGRHDDGGISRVKQNRETDGSEVHCSSAVERNYRRRPTRQRYNGHNADTQIRRAPLPSLFVRRSDATYYVVRIDGTWYLGTCIVSRLLQIASHYSTLLRRSIPSIPALLQYLLRYHSISRVVKPSIQTLNQIHRTTFLGTPPYCVSK